MPFKMSIAGLKESLESEQKVIKETLKEIDKENVKDTSVKKLLEKLDSDIGLFVSKIEADFESGLKEYDMAKFLNNMLRLEYQGIFDYNYYASLVNDEKLANRLRAFGVMEIEHARLLIEKIKKLGAKPKVSDATKRNKFKNALEMLREHSSAEQESINLCEEGVGVFSDPEFQWILGTIRLDELEHQKEIKDLINKFKDIEIVFKGNAKYNPPKNINFDSDEPWTEG